ncbi:MAG TPA: hypothetical protein VG963_03770, partial [Polyangiaceae bacterium]|nr:hypothetical protein [Polyangiaceae bacterium]
GRWTLMVSIEEVQAHRPASVKQLIDMQLDRLSPTEQRVLEAASIVGADFSTSLTAAALELSDEQVDDTCDSLLRRSLFLRAEPEQRYAFTHALVQEVCLERSSPLRRRRWHRRVAEALERDPRAADGAHLLAKHFDAADDPARALPAYLAAARQAALKHATSDTIALCARALELLPGVTANRERDLLEFELLGTMCNQVSSNSFKATFAGRDAPSVYARAIEIARTLGDVARSYAAITRWCNYEMIIAAYARTGEWLAELERIEQENDLDPALLHGGIFARAFIAFYSGNLATALQLFERLAPPEHEPSIFHHNLPGRAIALGHLACARCVAGDSERALEEALSTIRLAERLEIPILLALGHVVRARLRYLRRDRLPGIEAEMLDAVRAASVDVGLLTEARIFALWAEAQRSPVALSVFQPLLDTLRHRLTEVSTGSTLIGGALIGALRISGHVAEACELTDEIIAFARAQEHIYLPELLTIRGEQLEQTHPDLAARDYQESIDLARATGARGLEQRARDRWAAVTNGLDARPRQRPSATSD